MGFDNSLEFNLTSFISRFQMHFSSFYYVYPNHFSVSLTESPERT
jgi:hypothetical protein